MQYQYLPRYTYNTSYTESSLAGSDLLPSSITGQANGNIKKIINLDLNDENLSDLEIIMDEDEKKYVGAVLIEKNHQKNTAIIKDITYIDNKPRHIKKIINALFTDNHFENIIIHVKNGEEKQ